LCRVEATSSRLGASASSIAVCALASSRRHATRCPRQEITACTRCFIFFSFTKLPLAVRYPRPFSSKLVCHCFSSSGFSCDISSPLAAAPFSAAPCSRETSQRALYSDGQQPKRPGWAVKATWSSSATIGLSVSSEFAMRRTSHRRVLAAASADECPRACRSSCCAWRSLYFRASACHSTPAIAASGKLMSRLQSRWDTTAALGEVIAQVVTNTATQRRPELKRRIGRQNASG